MKSFLFATILMMALATVIVAQTSAFTYQGRFTDGGSAAKGTYEMQFKLFDGASNQIGSTVTNAAVVVSDGVFTVQLDYGSAAFSGSDRFLEIGVRSAGSGDPYTVLAPRQQLTSAVYAIRSGSTTTADNAMNATQLGGVAASQYVQVTDSRLTDARSPSAGSGNYIQNTNSLQASSNFNISGNGTAAGILSAGAVNTASQYNIAGKRFLSGPGNQNLFLGLDTGLANTNGFYNIFVGGAAGSANTTGAFNTFVGKSAGNFNTTGDSNSFFGYIAGLQNTTGFENSIFGKETGYSNTTGTGNSFFGAFAGHENTTGNVNNFFGVAAGKSNTTGSSNDFFGTSAGAANTTASNNAFFGFETGTKSTGGSNSFFGSNSGLSNTIGFANSFFGMEAGNANTTGFDNVFLGRSAGATNTTGSANTTIGFGADVSLGNLSNATAIGSNAQVNQSNSLVLGSISGVNGAAANTNVGIGTTTPNERLTIKTVTSSYGMVHTDGNITVGTYVGGSTGGGWIGTKSNHSLSFFTNNGGAAMTLETSGFLRLNNVDSGGQLQLCIGASQHISFCSSSLRYKTALKDFKGGLNVVNRLRPLSFTWKDGGMRDLGFGAEDVAAVEPLLVTRNDKGEVEGVKYDRITAVLVNAVKEQQEQIKQQQSQLAQQQKQIADLQRLVLRKPRRARASR